MKRILVIIVVIGTFSSCSICGLGKDKSGLQIMSDKPNTDIQTHKEKNQ